jgi:hypothetical protein
LDGLSFILELFNGAEEEDDIVDDNDIVDTIINKTVNACVSSWCSIKFSAYSGFAILIPVDAFSYF